MMKFQRFATTGLVAAALLAAALAPTPASAWRGWQGWFGEGSWDTPALLVLGGLLAGTVSTGAGAYPAPQIFGHYGYPPFHGYPYPVRSCVVQNPVYDGWGDFAGYRPMRLARRFCRLPTDAQGLLGRFGSPGVSLLRRTRWTWDIAVPANEVPWAAG